MSAMWRSTLTGTRSHLLPRLSSVISGRLYATDHNPPPKCSDSAEGGKSCGKLQECGDLRYEKKEPPKGEFQFHHLVKQPPECCEDPCQERSPKFDDCYYKISDKAKRVYQVTWVECPPIQIKPKKICCFKNAKHPPIQRRKRKDFVAAAECPKECTNVPDGPCPKIKMPGCRPVGTTSCYIVRRKTDCTKVKTPYPAFSECSRGRIRPPKRIECNCLAIPSLCEILAEQQRQEGNPGNKQCGGSRG
ncbi:uncharacterized protein LOC110177937 [Drosophila serrata]|uniref:uncharacterized protein LOC110177937 n=1 Tax=Drosophila serrata TaxID=7274 RepID=UPI000A1D045C|nr:uncharacterized protein LOC110177937 [Drosophila serrata]